MDEAARVGLAKAVAEVGSAEAPAGTTSVALPGTNTKGLVATILSLSGGRRQKLSLTFPATVAIFVQDPITETHLPDGAFAKLFGFTRSEMRLLAAMWPAHCIKEVAKLLGISEATAKTHLQHIFAKTGTSKQTELMSLFTRSVLSLELDPKAPSANPENTPMYRN
jgi:DNA-binding NarL/FixJ family response regulator